MGSEMDISEYDVKESLEAAEYIAEKAQDVKIYKRGIEKLAFHTLKFLNTHKKGHIYGLNNIFFRADSYPHISDERVTDWLFVIHTLNFSLFNPKGTKQWRAGNAEGYFGLCYAIKRAIDEGKPLWNPKYYTQITQNELEYIFRSDDGKMNIPLIHERLLILRDVGNILLKKYQGTFVECIKASDYNADKLEKLLFDEFDLYRDEVIYENKVVRLHTKAKLLVSDIWACYRKERKFHLTTKSMMSTMFIQYRTPIILLHFGILSYSERLVNRFRNNDKPLEDGSREEIEIRACSLVAANQVFKLLESQLISVDLKYEKLYNLPILIDNFLFAFLEAKINVYMREQPFHYIRSMQY